MVLCQALEKNFDIYSLTHEFGHYIQNILLAEYYNKNLEIHYKMCKKVKETSNENERINIADSFDFIFTDKMKNAILKIAEKLDEKFELKNIFLIMVLIIQKNFLLNVLQIVSVAI